MVKRPSIVREAERVQDKILCFLHYRFAQSENIVFTEKEIAEVLPGINPRIVHYSLEELDSETVWVSTELVEDFDEQQKATTSINPKPLVKGYMISTDGIKWVEGWPEERYESAADGVDLLTDDIPAAGRMVSLDHNDPAYEEAIKSVDAVIAELEKPSSKDNERGAERNALRDALLAGRRLLEDTTVNVKVAITLVVEPLKTVARRYDQTIVASLATAAITALLSLLGLG